MKQFLVVFCMFASITSFAQNNQAQQISSKKFMTAVMLEGLQKNNFDPTVAKIISTDYSLYIGKCQICEGVRSAFTDYSKTAKIEATVYTNIKALTDTSTKVKLQALETLVQQYVQAYYTAHDYTKEQQIAMEKQLANEADRSKMLTKASYCASCTGSCKKPE
jgi:hypothetical protein